jgi:hypothetical protein
MLGLSARTDGMALRLAIFAVGLCFPVFHCQAQDLTPRAYLITPIHSNAVVLSYSFETGDILLNPTLPISNAQGTLHIPIISYSHSLNFFGRTANFSAALPYAVGHFKAQLNGVPEAVYRSGLYDSQFRFSVNLKGGPAMDVRQFLKICTGLWKRACAICAAF